MLSIWDYVVIPYISYIANVIFATGLFYWLDTRQPSWYKSFCIQPKAQISPNQVYDRYMKSLPRTIINVCGVSCAMGILMCITGEYIQWFSSDTYYLWKIAVSVLMSEVLFFSVHRLFHHPYFYEYCHKMHHENPAPRILDAFYGPLPDMICVNLAFLIPPFITNMTPNELNLYMLGVAWVNMLTHTGYQIPYTLNIKRHDAHHQYFTCNYGFLGIMDWMTGSLRIESNFKIFVNSLLIN